MSEDPSSVADDVRHQALVKWLKDLDDLVRLFLNRLPLAKPWQRQLISDLGVVDRAIEVFRMTVAMERPDAEIVEAAQRLAQACRKAATVIAGARCDLETKAAIRLIVNLSARLHNAVRSADR